MDESKNTSLHLYINNLKVKLRDEFSDNVYRKSPIF